MRFLIFGFLSALLFLGCTSNRETVSLPSLGYEMKSYRVTSSPGCDDDTACTVFEVSYPVFTGIDSASAKKIQREIELSFSLGDPEAENKTLEVEAREFVDSYNKFTTEVEGQQHAWNFNGIARVNVLFDTLISISIDEEFYTGGAHGGGGKYFININPKTNDEVHLSSILKPGFQKDLTNLAEKAFRQERKLAANDDLQENGFEFPDNSFKLNENYGFTNEGITFFYNNYEIAPYALGTTEVFIPFEKILDWLIVKPVVKSRG